jgi:hypothetical protein
MFVTDIDRLLSRNHLLSLLCLNDSLCVNICSLSRLMRDAVTAHEHYRTTHSWTWSSQININTQSYGTATTTFVISSSMNFAVRINFHLLYLFTFRMVWDLGDAYLRVHIPLKVYIDTCLVRVLSSSILV